MKKRLLTIILVFCLCATLLPTVAMGSDVHFERVTVYFQDQFSDVPANQWYTESVAEAFELGLMKGDSDTTFNPHGDVTVAEAVTMAARIYSTYTTGSASAADNAAAPEGSAWYRRYFEYAYENGIISYAFYNSDATQKANRGQFAEIFANSLPGEALESINTVADNAIPDVKTSDRYAEHIYKLYRAGILAGSDANGTFNPQTYITRAESATIVSRMAESDNRVSITLGSPSNQTPDDGKGQTPGTNENQTVGDGSNQTPQPQQPEQTEQPEQSNTSTDVALVDLDYFSGSDKIQVSTNEKDNIGNTYSDCIMNNFDRTYMINGAYTKMAGVVFQEYAKRSDSVHVRHSKFEVYGDGKLLYSINFSALDAEYYNHASGNYFTGFKPIEFSIDISGVTELRVLFGDGEAGTMVASYDGPLALGDCILYK